MLTDLLNIHDLKTGIMVKYCQKINLKKIMKIMKKQFDKHILHGIVLAVSQEWHSNSNKKQGERT
jgi:hypothetical protein